ncbi:PITH domain-containing protein [Aspergillus sp. HF37]|nr:PITH domain-containing protein [Aspergillus sp. HF37]
MSSTLVNISSKEQFSSLLSSSRILVADFHADWCGPCKAIAPAYEQLARQLTRPNRITFTKINVDEQQDIAKAYGVSAMPTFIIFERGRPVSTVRGADSRKLNEVVQRLASEASKDDEGGSGDGETSSGDVWLGASIPRGFSDITTQYDPKALELLNRDSEFGLPRVLLEPSRPSSLADGKGKGKAASAGGSPDWVESDTDEQLMLYVPFQSNIKIHTLLVTSLPSEEEDEMPMRPKTIKLYTNRSQVLGFDEADDTPAVQTVTINPEDWDARTGTARVELRFVKFQNVTSLVFFFVDGDGDGEKLRVDRLRILGDAGEKREMGKLEKIGDEIGE